MKKILPSIYILLLSLPWLLVAVIIVPVKFSYFVFGPSLLASSLFLLLNLTLLDWEDYRTRKKFFILYFFYFLGLIGFFFAMLHIESKGVRFNEFMILVPIFAVYICPVLGILIYFINKFLKFSFNIGKETKEYLKVEKEYEEMNKISQFDQNR
jgi:hypothetical protein